MLSEIEALLRADPEFRAALMSLLLRAGLYQGQGARMMIQAQAAAAVLASGTKRNEGQGMLCNRFGISRATAYRRFDKALDIRQGTLF